MSDGKKYKLITRSDFDGLVCAVLFKELDMLDEIEFVHPKDMQDGKVRVDERCITTNVPYVDGCHLAFDHHESEIHRLGPRQRPNHIIDCEAPSTARVVWDHFGGEKAFPNVSEEMMWAVDRGDAAVFTEDEIRDPHGWVLLNFIMDARTGLGRFQQFRISNRTLMMQLIDYCREHTIDELLALPDVAARVRLYRQQFPLAQEQILRCSKVHGDLVVLDLREETVIHPCNRFMIYALFPQCNISIHVLWGMKRQNTVFAIGNSILNRTSQVRIGDLCLRYGGGGHPNAGTCQVSHEMAEKVLGELIAAITSPGLISVPVRSGA